MIVHTDADMTVDISVTPEMKDQVFNRVLDYFRSHGCWSGEISSIPLSA